MTSKTRFVAWIALASWTALFVANTPATAKVRSSYILWSDINVTKKIDGRWSYQFVVAPRPASRGTSYSPISVVPLSLGWAATKNVSLWGGYVYAYITTASGSHIREHRFFQEINYPLAQVGRLSLSGRSRLEERGFERIGEKLAIRMRQRLTLSMPITDEKRPIKAVAYVEPIVNLRSFDDAPYQRLAQVRMFGDLSMPVHRQAALTWGYMNQRSDEGTYQQSNSTLLLSLAINL